MISQGNSTFPVLLDVVVAFFVQRSIHAVTRHGRRERKKRCGSKRGSRGHTGGWVSAWARLSLPSTCFGFLVGDAGHVVSSTFKNAGPSVQYIQLANSTADISLVARLVGFLGGGAIALGW